MNAIKKILKTIIPENIRSAIALRMARSKQEQFLKKLRSDILSYYRQQTEVTPEQQEVIDYLQSNSVTVFPYAFRKKYDKGAIKVEFDQDKGLRYVWHEGKKLYFKRSYTDNMIRSLYYGLQLDQDPDSPHLYLTDNFQLSDNDVIADIGAAEGNFSLSNVEKVRRICLFEYDPEWIEALEATFEPWKDKVEIYNKFVTDHDSETTISIDSFTQKHGEVSFLKVDIEGEEAKFLKGADHYLDATPNLKMAICTYHQQEDETKFTDLLKAKNFDVKASKRYMIFYHDDQIKAPYLRRGLLRAQK